ncbi:MAG: hypothetical protein A2381_13035 [Bdellovibrionales bacterium RIFOXYB1_FULL_37_110]|nr:MAG: hypothetical protein A2181_02360 [Bdellovibrionales bacterium RIFOXYA1_FULL_38_20]OFZ51632.1 MAG: hypothetical protein A2417_12695 [Bdellovibrionales bacterium RIFOXYC1_FULL_37_79]OFZ60459.1 MAG: hypothetical protein A2381_13035 [Bdellovibrionales bacterium RIFOXYB1_FULL_37_110]OFZ65032.1 MAG: hypothetical protein A2577_09300 [Bdellovibrionales bacterium RIFOXYD1_FULL_36_51]OFZ67290.1 MAG: hypothetical protein A2328_10560 [Bdellovibrionales bacterium RIFOXYB2_FULL_36_6]
MSIDYGEKYVGLATFIPGNDPYPLCFERIRFQSPKQLISDLIKYVSEEAIAVLVLGIPRLLDGKETKATEKIKHFGELLKASIPNVCVYFQDETLSTFDAKDRMKNSPEFNFKVAMDKIDMVSAVIILEDFIADKNQLSE